jgi:DNA-binding NtrC family response regulator
MTKHRILVFGNDRYASLIIRWILEYNGCQARSVFGPEAAIKALTKRKYGLVIAKSCAGSDDSLRVLKRGKQLNPIMKIILMSDNYSLVFPWEAYCIEVDDYLLMPMSPTELWRRVSRCLESEPDLRAGASKKTRLAPLTRKGRPYGQEIPLG